MSEQNDAPRANWMPTALDNEAEAFIKTMEKDFVPTEGTEAPAEGTVSAEAAPEAGTPNQSPATSEPAGDVKATLDADKSKPEQISDFVARELALYRREEAIAAKEAHFQTLEARLVELERSQVPGDLLESLRTQSTKTLEALGIDPDFLVKQVLAERMGDKAPEDLRVEVREAAERLQTRREIQGLKQKLAEQERADRARAFFQEVQNGAREYLKAPGLSEYAPTVAKVVTSNSDMVFSEIMAEIQRDAETKAYRNPNAPLMTYEEAAKRVESRWSAYSKAFGQPAQVPAQNAPADSASMARKPAPSNNAPLKTPDRPIAPWLQRSTELEEEGIKAAIAEFKRTQG